MTSLIAVDWRNLHWVLANAYGGATALVGGLLFDLIRWRKKFTLLQLMLVCALVGFLLQMMIEFRHASGK